MTDPADADLPAIFHYWSNRYLQPLCRELGFSTPDEFFAQHVTHAVARCDTALPEIVSIGAGTCDTEVAVAAQLRDAGLDYFTIECLEPDRALLERGRENAGRAGVASHLRFTEADAGAWQPTHRYHAVMANHALSRVTNLEGLFDAVRGALHPRGSFVIADIIGRNGHQRWPEALAAVARFWAELPPGYRYNHVLKRCEATYENGDCSAAGGAGVRAQDIMPLLLERFEFELFLGFSNVVSVFIDRAFGHNFDASGEWDRAFIDRVHAFDEAGIRDGTLTPCQMFAVLTAGEPEGRSYVRGVPPESAVHPSVRPR